ncbi:MAG: hypothetical protein MJ200_01840 [Mycoplasmoidaceae bacterium]|nr:hypothetical protein [Mycoplasmoidaceae bacterium]
MKLTKLLPIIGISGTLAASPALMTSCTKPTKYIQLNQFHSGSDNDSYLSSGKFNIKKNETVKLTIQMSD